MVERRSRPGQPKPRIDDVANLAGVSIKTVSRVLNEEPNVSKVTRNKVLTAIQRLDYSPCLEARRLAESKNHATSSAASSSCANSEVVAICSEGGYGKEGLSLHAELLRIADLRQRRIISNNEFELQIIMLLTRLG